jgi:plasmid stabilization system protein ParE
MKELQQIADVDFSRAFIYKVTESEIIVLRVRHAKQEPPEY